MTLLFVFGTRPEAIKLGPVAAELAAVKTPFGVLCTGQHTSLLEGTPAETDLAGPNTFSLGLASDGDVLKWTMRAEMKVREFLETWDSLEQLDPVVVQGDTMSALAAARAAKVLGRTLVHVEAGVRSGDLKNPWPEEGFRREITGLADWHYAPTAHCFANLVAEGVAPARVRVTGNSVVSALARYTAARPVPAEDHVLVTLHRRELLQSEAFAGVVQALIDEAAHRPELKFLWPVHPATLPLLGGFEGPPNLLLGNPLSYVNFVGWLATARGVLTDSGGLVEEACTLGVPNATLRVATDRPEALTIALGSRWSPDPAGVRGAVAWLAREHSRQPSNVFGEIGAAGAIARLLAAL